MNILQYADDTCLVANSPASCQFLLSKVSDWLRWSGMTAKVPKCHCILLQGSTGRLQDPHLQLDGVPTCSPIRFLGMNAQVPSTDNTSRKAVLARLQAMLEAVDVTPLTRPHKLLLYKAGVCPRLTWPLLIQEYPISWVQQQVDAVATHYMKRWAGLAKSANTAILIQMVASTFHFSRPYTRSCKCHAGAIC